MSLNCLEGEKSIIPYFYNKCCFNVNDERENAHKIIYPGSNGDPWWDNKQLLVQIKSTIKIYKESSAHVFLPSDALYAFEMNMSNGDSTSTIECHKKVQKMTILEGAPKGLKAIFEKCGFNIHKLHAKCKPICLFESKNCYMARLLTGHKCIFLPKFHYELNPIKMSKYQYQNIHKTNFAHILDSYAIEVI
ncbi:hypothetical protein OBBRIDRAFT_811541 [Obba rivulosa]|uniref:Uncharacterized protein n=1 Tax=Obba rivulosa TaxID=1052685 RepID=A0A8E2AXX8_9APHY|nr:hypothetical protein OBBRIDRAFT_811541 [Obba rivulosa]